MASVWLALGLAVLTGGAEILVRGAVGLAAAARISPLVIGLTVVAFGTSAPELVVSVQTALHGQPEIALGNVVGSNILNVLLILGVSSLIVPLLVSQQLIRIEVPLMIGASVLMLLLSLDGRIGRLEGILLVAGLVSYTVWGVRQSRREQAAIVAEYREEYGPEAADATAHPLVQAALVAAGLLLLVVGSRWFTSAAVDIARMVGVSELVIGLTIVAAGTSLPEVATSIMAAVRGERDIAVGNIVGSNMFNIMGVLGVASAVAPAGVTVPLEAVRFDIPVMIAVAASCLPIFFTGHLIARWEGALFLGYYVAYTAYLVLAATHSSITNGFELFMLEFVIPLTAVTLAIGVWRTWRAPKAVEIPPAARL